MTVNAVRSSVVEPSASPLMTAVRRGAITNKAQATSQFNALKDRINQVGELLRNAKNIDQVMPAASALLAPLYAPEFRGLQGPDGKLFESGGRKGPDAMAATLISLAGGGAPGRLHVDHIDGNRVSSQGAQWENWNHARYVKPPTPDKQFWAREVVTFDALGRIVKHQIIEQVLEPTLGQAR